MSYFCAFLFVMIIFFIIITVILYFSEFLLVLFSFIPFCICLLLVFGCININSFYAFITEDKIKITRQRNILKKYRVQFEFEIFKDDVISIDYTWRDFTNSLGEKNVCCIKGYKYLVFNMKDGSKNKLWAEVFSEKQLKEITYFYLNKK